MVASYRWRVQEVVQESTSWSSLGRCVSSSSVHTGDQYWVAHPPSRDCWRRQVRTPGQVSNHTQAHTTDVSIERTKRYYWPCRSSPARVECHVTKELDFFKQHWALQPISQSVNQPISQVVSEAVTLKCVSSTIFQQLICSCISVKHQTTYDVACMRIK